jgi:hypothetical protein
MTVRKLVTVQANGPIRELQGIAGPIKKPTRIPLNAIVKMVTNGKLVFEHDPEDPSKKVRLTIANVKATNFGSESTRIPTAPVKPTPVEKPVEPTPVEPEPAAPTEPEPEPEEVKEPEEAPSEEPETVDDTPVETTPEEKADETVEPEEPTNVETEEPDGSPEE